MVFRLPRSLSFQFGSVSPMKKKLLPLSARIMPKFFSPFKMAWLMAEKPEMLTLDRRRNRAPSGSRLAVVVLLAPWLAGNTKYPPLEAPKVGSMVKRSEERRVGK